MRVACGVARTIGAPVRVIAMVASNKNYGLQKNYLLNLISFDLVI
jgi:hypothetical protein